MLHCHLSWSIVTELNRAAITALFQNTCFYNAVYMRLGEDTPQYLLLLKIMINKHLSLFICAAATKPQHPVVSLSIWV